MKYKLITVGVGGGIGGINLQSTDPSVLDAVLTEVRKIAPRIQVYSPPLYELSHGTSCGLIIKGLGNKDPGIGWFIMQFLCESGWEPFAVQTPRVDVLAEANYVFRLSV